MNVSIRNNPIAPGKADVNRAYCILKYAHDTSRSLLTIFNAKVKTRGRGTTTDEEQDLLRGMLVSAGAGL